MKISKQPLPVTIGYPRAISLKVSENHKLHVGILAMPASFEKERIHVYRTAMDALYNREIFAAPGEQSLFFILSERDAILTNAYLQLFRTNSAINDAVLINGDLYLTGSFSSERSKIFKISKSAIENIQ